jgi:glycosyltransferase involved in cell wall biosynthesis
MFAGKRVAVVVPAYNEARLIERAVSQVPEFVDQVLVVDDASTDGTLDALNGEARRPGLECIRHETNQGVGGAIVSGYRRALNSGADLIVVMAGDAQMDPEDLPALLEPLARDRADYSKGDRLSWPGAFRLMPLFRFVGNHALSRLTRFTSGYRDVRDSQCGYTALNRSILQRLDLDKLYTRYGFPNDILAHLHAAGARLAQVPVRPIYGEEISGISWFTALVRVPLVLLRSYLTRRRRGSQGSCAVLDNPRPEPLE